MSTIGRAASAIGRTHGRYGAKKPDAIGAVRRCKLPTFARNRNTNRSERRLWSLNTLRASWKPLSLARRSARSAMQRLLRCGSTSDCDGLKFTNYEPSMFRSNGTRRFASKS